jgi:hypothetical protein
MTPAEQWATDQVQAAIAVLSDHRALDWHREAIEAEARQRSDDWLAHAEACEIRARQYDAWAAEYPASHRFHHRYVEMADEQRRLKDRAMQRYHQERNRL